MSSFYLNMDDLIAKIIKSLPIHNDNRTTKFSKPEIQPQDVYNISDEKFPFLITTSDLNHDEFIEIKADEARLNYRSPSCVQINVIDNNCEPKKSVFDGISESDVNAELDSILSNKQAKHASIDFNKLTRYDSKRSVPPGFNYGIDFSISQNQDFDQAKFNEAEQNETIDNDGAEEEKIIPLLKAEVPSTSGVGQVIDDLTFLKIEETETNAIKLDKTSRSTMAAKMNYLYAKSVDVRAHVPDFRQRVPVMAHEYPFELDIFQKQAVLHLESGNTVFVAAHTSAGKTVVAEYAIALCQRHCTRAIYTSPIKALSNQKFRDFKKTFKDVGLITGDIQLNPNAFCLIMTTEILRSMLINKSETLLDLEWVIFDEVHYINDPERGVVWEEVIIFLPKYVKIIMLSATVANTMAFAEWVGRIKDRQVYVISTPKRPVPLEHFLYTGSDGKTKNDRFLLVDQHSKLHKSGHEKALESKGVRNTGTKRLISAQNPKTERNMWVHLVDHLQKKELLPCVVFTFSRKRCDTNASMLTSLDLTTSSEKSHVHHFFDICTSRLKDTDKHLPQVKTMAEICKRGLAVHHSGILPILKETVEMLFQKNCIKVLFATETFAMGVNMPARTVIFDSIQKHDGHTFRILRPGEYTQMAGRAGRRGLDTTGTVILLCKTDVPDLRTLEATILGRPDELISQFRITYPLILNALRAREFQVEDILKGSFAETATWCEKLQRQEKIDAVRKKLANRQAVSCKFCQQGQNLEKFYGLARKLLQMNQNFRVSLSNSINSIFQPGTFVCFGRGIHKDLPALVVNQKWASKKTNNLCLLILGKENSIGRSLRPHYQEKWSEIELILFDLIYPESDLKNEDIEDEFVSVKSSYSIVEVELQSINEILPENIKFGDFNLLETLTEDHFRRNKVSGRAQKLDEHTLDSLKVLENFFESIDFSTGQSFNCWNQNFTADSDLLESSIKIKTDLAQMGETLKNSCPDYLNHCIELHEYEKLKALQSAYQKSNIPEQLQLSDEYLAKLGTLQYLGYVDERQLLTMKGKVACYVNNFELLISEILLDNLLGPLQPCEIAAVLSCTTNQHKVKGQSIDLPKNLEKLRQNVAEIAQRICDAQTRNGVFDNDIQSQLQYSLMEVVYEWARGTPFVEITKLTEAQEGIIVRCIMRLDEVCRDVKSAAKLLGNTALEAKMEDTSQAIRRDIVFAASLYTVL